MWIGWRPAFMFRMIGVDGVAQARRADDHAPHALADRAAQAGPQRDQRADRLGRRADVEAEVAAVQLRRRRRTGRCRGSSLAPQGEAPRGA